MDAPLLAALILLPFINWPVAIILLRLAWVRPRIKALTERAWYATIIAACTTIYVLIAVNTNLGNALFSLEAGRLTVRLMFLGIGLYPLWWLWSYLTGGFGGDASNRP